MEIKKLKSAEQSGARDVGRVYEMNSRTKGME